jgi:hypothetical protein
MASCCACKIDLVGVSCSLLTITRLRQPRRTLYICDNCAERDGLRAPFILGTMTAPREVLQPPAPRVHQAPAAGTVAHHVNTGRYVPPEPVGTLVRHPEAVAAPAAPHPQLATAVSPLKLGPPVIVSPVLIPPPAPVQVKVPK